MRLACLLLVLLGCATRVPRDAAAPPGTPHAGPWRAWLDAQGQEVPFDLELRTEAGAWHARIENGEERIEVPQVALADGTLTLGFPHYDSVIVAQVSERGARLDGTWRKRRGADDWCELPFHADAGEHPRFRAGGSGKPWPTSAEAVGGRWAVRFASSADPAVGIFSITSEGEGRGTFLTTTGDDRYLAGRIDREGPGMDSLLQGTDAAGIYYGVRLSCFDGAHAFLFTALLQPDGTLQGDFWSSDRWHDTWTATRDDFAQLPDGFSLSKASGAVSLDDLVFPDLDGTPRRLSDPQFAGKARLIEIFGSWCPNCADEADELVRLQKEFGARGLTIIGLAFEVTGDHARDAEQVRRYAARHGVTWPLLVAGLADKDMATASLGLLDKVRAFPTTIFLDEQGKVRAVYTGFSGPATGAAYAEQHAEFVRVIEGLLGP